MLNLFCWALTSKSITFTGLWSSELVQACFSHPHFLKKICERVTCPCRLDTSWGLVCLTACTRPVCDTGAFLPLCSLPWAWQQKCALHSHASFIHVRFVLGMIWWGTDTAFLQKSPQRWFQGDCKLESWELATLWLLSSSCCQLWCCTGGDCCLYTIPTSLERCPKGGQKLDAHSGWMQLSGSWQMVLQRQSARSSQSSHAPCQEASLLLLYSKSSVASAVDKLAEFTTVIIASAGLYSA